ncbi:MAG: hypothetical protein ACLUD2_20475 [Clostridium sp.]
MDAHTFDLHNSEMAEGNVMTEYDVQSSAQRESPSASWWRPEKNKSSLFKRIEGAGLHTILRETAMGVYGA